MILTILAKQMRLLERRVPVELGDSTMLTATGSQLSITEIKIKGTKKKKHRKKEISSTSSSSESERRPSIKTEKMATLEKTAPKKPAVPGKNEEEKHATEKTQQKELATSEKSSTKTLLSSKDERGKLTPAKHGVCNKEKGGKVVSLKTNIIREVCLIRKKRDT